jgi:hypothetical protein
VKKPEKAQFVNLLLSVDFVAVTDAARETSKPQSPKTARFWSSGLFYSLLFPQIFGGNGTHHALFSGAHPVDTKRRIEANRRNIDAHSTVRRRDRDPGVAEAISRVMVRQSLGSMPNCCSHLAAAMLVRNKIYEDDEIRKYLMLSQQSDIRLVRFSRLRR